MTSRRPCFTASFDPDRRHDDGIDAVEHRRDYILIAILPQPLNAMGRIAGKTSCQHLQRFRLLSSRPAPDPQPAVSLQLSERLDEIVDALRGSVRSDVAEGEGLAFLSRAAAEPLPIEPVVQVRELAVRKAELVPKASKQVLRRGDEEVDQIRHLVQVLHPVRDPRRPVGDVGV